MDYNTQKKKLILPEYGRNIQKMVDFAIEIQDKETKLKAVKTIISVMGNLYPHLRDVPDFRHKLWDHLAIMSNFKLDIEWPYPLPQIEEINQKPERLPYNTNRIKFKHYGRTIEKFISKINTIDSNEERETYISLLANHMKKSFLIWNNDSVEDEQIIEDIKRLSPISIDHEIKLSSSKDIMQKRPRPVKRNDKPHRFTKKINSNKKNE